MFCCCVDAKHNQSAMKHQTNTYIINIPQPLCDIVEGLVIGDVVDEKDTHRAAIVRGGYRVKTLLTGGVPVK